MSAFEIAFEQLYSSISTAKLQANLSANLLANQLALGTLTSKVGNGVDDDRRGQIAIIVAAKLGDGRKLPAGLAAGLVGKISQHPACQN